MLLALTQGGAPLVVTTAAALLDPLPAPGDGLAEHVRDHARAKRCRAIRCSNISSTAGYKREMLVEGVGQFAVRGAVVDIYPFGAPQPVRLEFFGEDVESLRTFDPSTQKSTGEIDSDHADGRRSRARKTGAPARPSAAGYRASSGATAAARGTRSRRSFEERTTFAAGRRDPRLLAG